jgi:hypothetical protein
MDRWPRTLPENENTIQETTRERRLERCGPWLRVDADAFGPVAE